MSAICYIDASTMLYNITMHSLYYNIVVDNINCRR